MSKSSGKSAVSSSKRLEGTKLRRRQRRSAVLSPSVRPCHACTVAQTHDDCQQGWREQGSGRTRTVEWTNPLWLLRLTRRWRPLHYCRLPRVSARHVQPMYYSRPSAGQPHHLLTPSAQRSSALTTHHVHPPGVCHWVTRRNTSVLHCNIFC